ncbi:MAG: polysaccharide deacetylase family protein [Terriglobales bacterium]
MAIRPLVRACLWSAAGRSGAAPAASRLLHRPTKLRVLMYHDVPKNLLLIFESHLEWLLKNFEFIKPSDLPNQPSAGNRPKLLLTFDDGCLDNYELVAPLLESRGVRGLFFVCPGFGGLDRQASFTLMERSSVLLREKTRDSSWQRLSREQIVDLDQRGHGIGSHTMTHTPLAKIDEPHALREVEHSAETLASWLRHPCHFFAWTYSWDGITSASLASAMHHHEFCFSPCCGLNRWPVRERLLWRTGVDVSKPVSHLQTQLSGLVDFAYRHQRQSLRSLSKSAIEGSATFSKIFIPQ